MSEIVPHIRWMIRSDLREVLRIEAESFDSCWSECDFLTALRQRNCIGMVAEWKSRVIGFMVYELHKQQLSVLNFAVDPALRRKGIGTTLVKRLYDKLNQQRRREIVLLVRETNIGAQLFLKGLDFRADTVVHNYFWDCDEDAYVFRYLTERDEKEFAPGLAPRNRISKILEGGA